MALYFSNPLCGGQDPFICKGDDGYYYYVTESTGAKKIDLYRSRKLTEFCEHKNVFTAFKSGESSAEIWAPELWHLRGKWYIYYAGACKPGEEYWETHRMFVLEADHPFGPYRFVGKLELGERMSIDGTVMELPDGRLILFYMGRHGNNNCLFMAPMDTPTHISGEPVLLCEPTYPWEADINEGPFPILRNGQIYLMYSANAAHLPSYCIALLKCIDPDHIFQPSSWVKESAPIMLSSGDINGPGHACIVSSPDGTEDFLVFQSKINEDNELPGGWDRVVSLRRIEWDSNGRPMPVGSDTFGTEILCPSGERSNFESDDVAYDFSEFLPEFISYGYTRKVFVRFCNGVLTVDGAVSPDYENKLILHKKYYSNFSATFQAKASGANGIFGLLFRVSLPATGKNRWKGYGVFGCADGTLRLVRSNGKEVTVLGETHIDENEWHCITVRANRRLLEVSVNGKNVLWVTDSVYSAGQIGLCSLDGVGDYRALTVRNLKEVPEYA